MCRRARYDLALTDFAFPQAGALGKAGAYLFQAGVPGSPRV